MNLPDIKINDSQKSEEIQDIVERMPGKFGYWVTGIVLGIVCLLFFFGWLINYPDAVTGIIKINAKYAPIKLVANSPGKLLLGKFNPKDWVREGDYIATIQNSANVDDIETINKLLKHFNIDDKGIIADYPLFPKKVSLGEVNVKYYTFLNAMQQLYNYSIKNTFQKQEENLKSENAALLNLIANNGKLKETRVHNMSLSQKIYQRDSILLLEKASAEDDADHSKILYLNSKESYQALLNEIINDQQQLEDNSNKLEQLYIQKGDKEKQMRLDFLSAYNDLIDNLKAWDQHYAFKAPMDGRVEYLKFWNNNQFILAGEEVFSIIPKETEIIGQVELPAHGAGKVKIGQQVIIKLDNYPFEEYGSINGTVSSISLITNTVKTKDENNSENYLVEVALPNGLVTNYGSKLEFRYEIKGTADIISKRRKLIERFFDNLKNSANKQ